MAMAHSVKALPNNTYCMLVSGSSRAGTRKKGQHYTEYTFVRMYLGRAA
jgi:hypothetical protein